MPRLSAFNLFQAIAPWLGLCALVLVAVMAWVSAFNAHPDELYHVRAAEYYIQHWLPPRVGDPATLASYGPYGWSYLVEFDPVYFFAGKLAQLLSLLPLETYQLFRVFQLLLLVLCVLLVMVHDGRWIVVPLLISPQIWYVFSYFNSDAFPLFLSGLLGFTVFRRASPLLAVGEGSSRTGVIVSVVTAGALLGLLCLSKAN